MFIQENYFRNIFNTVREAILILDGDMRVLSANRSFFTTFKVDAGNTIGSLLYSLGNRQWDIAALRILLEEILPHNDTVDDYEIEHDFESIGHKTMLLNACKIREKDDAQPIILLAIEDITERKRLEDLLTESEVRYRRIFDTANDGIVLLEKCAGSIVHANPAAVNMLGYSAEEYAGKMLEDIGVPIDMSDFPRIMAALNRNGILNFDDVAVTTKSGGSIDTDIYLVDRAKSAQCNIRDVSERKRKEESLRQSEEKFRILFEQAADNIILLEVLAEGSPIIRDANSATFRCLGYEREELLGQPISFIDPVPDAYKTACKRRQENTAGKVSLFELGHRCKDGTILTFECSVSELQIGSDRFAISIERDLTERNLAIKEKSRLEAQLVQSQKMEAVGTLAGGIAHDFNNILNVIMGYGSMVLEKLAVGTPAKEQMNEVLIAAERAAALTRRLLVFSRKQIVEVKPVDINTLILGIENMLVRIIRENIDFKLKLADRSLLVLADAGQIEQVLMNLAVNARDAMPEGGRLTISTGVEEINADYVAAYGYGTPGKYALITVTDTGQGMDAETREKIFEQLFTTKGIGEGTGLGLAISYSIIKQHDGYIKVYSEPGQGSVFRIYLPLNEKAVTPDITVENVAPVKGGDETVLVAEDDASLRHLSRILLESYGYTVIAAEDGEDAITKFMDNRERISLVMLDMIMPRKSGKEACEAIKKANPDMKVLFMSGYTMDILTTEELAGCGADFISKPFLPNDLLQKVREVLDR